MVGLPAAPVIPFVDHSPARRRRHRSGEDKEIYVTEALTPDDGCKPLVTGATENLSAVRSSEPPIIALA